MKKTLVISIIVLALVQPVRAFSDTIGHETMIPPVQLIYPDTDAQIISASPRGVSRHSFTFRQIKPDALFTALENVPDDPARGNSFSALTSEFRAGYITPQQLISNIRITPYFGRADTSFKSSVFDPPSGFSDLLTMGTAFLTNLAAHEFGHAIIGDLVGARGNTVNFFNKQGGQFFLGMSSVNKIDPESKLSYTMGGEFFADLTFEHALKSYRNSPTFFNTSLMLFSGTDFLWYCFYAFYITEGHSSFDPVTVSKETGLGKDELFSIALAKTMINAYRIYSGQDRIIPYFTVNNRSTALNLSIPF